MSNTPRDRLVARLAEAAPTSAFSASATGPTDQLVLEVRGVGRLTLPVPETQSRELCRIGRPARYGQGGQTLFDTRVRDTWEIPKSRVRIDTRRWRPLLARVLDRIRRNLGLADGYTLEAEFHSMLVYARGQFFTTHQDSETDDSMIGTLVVSLPSSVHGGTLEVEHGGRVARYRGSRSALSFIAFYGDCRHRVLPVTSGHRVVLTYNLLLRGEPAAASETTANQKVIDELTSCFEDHFAAADAPDRFVYLLDHEYTPRSLGWAHLKGTDIGRAALFRSAAERADCEVVLALADVHESWSAYGNEEAAGRWYLGSRHRRWDDWEDDDLDDSDDRFAGGDSDDDEYELDELIESVVTLDAWIGPTEDHVTKVDLTIGEDEVCASTPSVGLHPYTSEYEGYMGNEGNTLDRWYHRSALVAWPRSRAFAVRAEASPSGALDELTARVGGGDLDGARAAASELEPFWDGVSGRVGAGELLDKALLTAHLLDDPALATVLLRPFRVEMLLPSHAKALSTLVERYGEQWAADLVHAWSTRPTWPGHPNGDRAAWVASLPRLCLALARAGTPGISIAASLLRESWRWAWKSMQEGLALTSPSQRAIRMSELGRPIAALLSGALLTDLHDLSEDVTARLCGEDAGTIVCAMHVLRRMPAPRWRETGLDVVATHSVAVLCSRLARPQRDSDDWSVELPQGCDCDLCHVLGGFLADPTRRTLEWPLAEKRRAHVHGRIDGAELPVEHRTRRVGRPYTLVLTKTNALFEREREARRRDERDLTWLRRRVEQAHSGERG